MEEKKLLTLYEFSKMTGVGYNTLAKLCRKGLLPGAVKIGVQWRIDIDEWKRNSRTHIAPSEKDVKARRRC